MNKYNNVPNEKNASLIKSIKDFITLNEKVIEIEKEIQDIKINVNIQEEIDNGNLKYLDIIKLMASSNHTQKLDLPKVIISSINTNQILICICYLTNIDTSHIIDKNSQKTDLQILTDVITYGLSKCEDGSVKIRAKNDICSLIKAVLVGLKIIKDHQYYSDLSFALVNEINGAITKERADQILKIIKDMK
jgi:hypothetical protein